jgi:hypothetical protein
MLYQRSEYKITKVGSLLSSNSPEFGRQDYISIGDEIQVEESWVIQNIEKNPVHIFSKKAFATIKDKKYSISCGEADKNAEDISLKSEEKAVLRCKWQFPKSSNFTNDLWIMFNIPTSEGGMISSNKIIRAEDLQ